jgi:hypothetical protein
VARAIIQQLFSKPLLRKTYRYDIVFLGFRDINVLQMSHIFSRLVSDNTPACNYIVNDHEYNMGYYLADDIYPEWATLAKTIQNPQNRAEAKFAKAQEAAQKDIERAFGVLQARFTIHAIVRGPSRFWDKRILLIERHLFM